MKGICSMDKKDNQSVEYKQQLQDAAEKILTGEFDIKKYYGLTKEAMDAIYLVGHEMYHHKQYDKARDVFGLLSMLEPTSTMYLSACGSACFMNEDYFNAAQFFRLAMLQGEYNPKTLLRMAECYVRLNQLDLVKRYTDEIIRLSDRDEYKDDKAVQGYIVRAKMMNDMIAAQKENAEKNSDAEKQEE